MCFSLWERVGLETDHQEEIAAFPAITPKVSFTSNANSFTVTHTCWDFYLNLLGSEGSPLTAAGCAYFPLHFPCSTTDSTILSRLNLENTRRSGSGFAYGQLDNLLNIAASALLLFIQLS